MQRVGARDLSGSPIEKPKLTEPQISQVALPKASASKSTETW